MSLEEIIGATHDDDSKTTIFNNAAQVWNHTFFWHCMAKGGGGEWAWLVFAPASSRSSRPRTR
jgi:superoxide dismutase